MTRIEPWTINQLAKEMQADLSACQSEFERINVRAVCGREIREHAERFAQTRKLTPGELAIAEQCGYRA